MIKVAAEPGGDRNRCSMVQVEAQLFYRINLAGENFRAENYIGPWGEFKRSIVALKDERSIELPTQAIKERYQAVQVLLELQQFYGIEPRKTILLDRERLRALQQYEPEGTTPNGCALQMWKRATRDSAYELQLGYLGLVHKESAEQNHHIAMFFSEVVERELYLKADSYFGGVSESESLMKDMQALKQWWVLTLDKGFREKVGYSLSFYKDIVQMYKRRQICPATVAILAHLCDFLVKRATEGRASLYFGEPALDGTIVNINNIRIALSEAERVE